MEIWWWLLVVILTLNQVRNSNAILSSDNIEKTGLPYHLASWKDSCLAIDRSFIKYGLTFQDVTSMTLHVRNSRTGEEYDVKINTENLYVPSKLDQIISPDAILTVTILRENLRAFIAWLKDHDLPYSEKIDLELIFKINPDITLNKILLNKEKWKNILQIIINIDFSNISLTGLLNLSYDKVWIVRNENQWYNILLNCRFPKILLDSIDWGYYFAKYNFVTPSWIANNVKEFVAQLIKIRNKKLTSDLDLYVELTIPYILQNQEVLKILFMKYGITNFSNIKWNLLLKMYPHLTLNEIINNASKWIVKIQNITNPSIIFGNIDFTWIIQNTRSWTDKLVELGFSSELLSRIDWELFISRYPYATPNWISLNLDKFVDMLNEIKDQHLPTIDLQKVLTLDFITQNKEAIKLWFLKNNIAYNDDLDWTIVLNVFKNIKLSSILNNISKWRTFITNEYPGFVQVKRELVIGPGYDVDWIISHYETWTQYLLQIGFSSEHVKGINWNKFFEINSHIKMSWIQNHPSEFIGLVIHFPKTLGPVVLINKEDIYIKAFGSINLDVITKILSTEFKNKFTLEILPALANIKLDWFLSIKLKVPTLNIIWIVQNKAMWVNYLVECGFPRLLVESIDWSNFFNKYPHITVTWIEENQINFIGLLLRELVFSWSSSNSLPLTKLKWELVLDMHKYITADWIKNNPKRWSEILIECGLNIQNIDWVAFLKKHSYITVEWLQNNTLSFINLINLNIGKSLEIDWSFLIDLKISTSLFEWVITNPIKWVKLLLKCGFPLVKIATINWVKVWKENTYLTLEWIMNNQEQWILLLDRYQNTVTDEKYKWNLMFSIQPYINEAWAEAHHDKLQAMLKVMGIKFEFGLGFPDILGIKKAILKLFLPKIKLFKEKGTIDDRRVHLNQIGNVIPFHFIHFGEGRPFDKKYNIQDDNIGNDSAQKNLIKIFPFRKYGSLNIKPHSSEEENDMVFRSFKHASKNSNNFNRKQNAVDIQNAESNFENPKYRLDDFEEKPGYEEREYMQRPNIIYDNPNYRFADSKEDLEYVDR